MCRSMLLLLLFVTFGSACYHAPEPYHPESVAALKDTMDGKTMVKEHKGHLFTYVVNHTLKFRPLHMGIKMINVTVLGLGGPWFEETYEWSELKNSNLRLPEPHEFFRFEIRYYLPNGTVKEQMEWAAEALFRHHHATREKTSSGIALDVIVVVWDSVSFPNFVRTCPKTRELLQSLGAIEMTGHNVLGINTSPNMFPFYTGFPEKYPLFEKARDNWEDPLNRSRASMDAFLNIFDTYAADGYVTAWGDEMTSWDVFETHHTGFKTSPVLHWMRPLYNDALCHIDAEWLGEAKLAALLQFEYASSLMRLYREQPKFFVFHTSSMTHSHSEYLDAMDDYMVHWIHQHIVPNKHRTMFVLMGDHGCRYGTIAYRTKFRAVVEHANPLMSITLPSWFSKHHPKYVQALQYNSRQVTTNYDVHATLQHLRTHASPPPPQIYGRSLFYHIPNRSCEEAGIPDEHCPCSRPIENLPLDTMLPALHAVVQHFNQRLKVVAKQCHTVQLHRPSVCAKAPDGSIWALFDVRREGEEHGFGSVRARFYWDAVSEVVSDVSADRTDKYGDQPACIAKEYPDLRPFCLCR